MWSRFRIDPYSDPHPHSSWDTNEALHFNSYQRPHQKNNVLNILSLSLSILFIQHNLKNKHLATSEQPQPVDWNNSISHHKLLSFYKIFSDELSVQKRGSFLLNQSRPFISPLFFFDKNMILTMNKIDHADSWTNGCQTHWWGCRTTTEEYRI